MFGKTKHTMPALLLMSAMISIYGAEPDLTAIPLAEIMRVASKSIFL